MSSLRYVEEIRRGCWQHGVHLHGLLQSCAQGMIYTGTFTTAGDGDGGTGTLGLPHGLGTRKALHPDAIVKKRRIFEDAEDFLFEYQHDEQEDHLDDILHNEEEKQQEDDEDEDDDENDDVEGSDEKDPHAQAFINSIDNNKKNTKIPKSSNQSTNSSLKPPFEASIRHHRPSLSLSSFIALSSFPSSTSSSTSSYSSLSHAHSLSSSSAHSHSQSHILISPIAPIYTGYFQHGVCEGYGVEYLLDGSILRVGYWREGKLDPNSIARGIPTSIIKHLPFISHHAKQADRFFCNGDYRIDRTGCVFDRENQLKFQDFWFRIRSIFAQDNDQNNNNINNGNQHDVNNNKDNDTSSITCHSQLILPTCKLIFCR